MSASREKKQRQGVGPSQKALQAQQERAARKRKTIIYSVVGAVVVVLVAALLVWRSATNGTIRDMITASHAKDTAATVGGSNISVAELSYHYYNAKTAAYYNEFYIYSYLGLEIPADSDVRNTETGQTYRDYYLETALHTAQENMALADLARKNGHTDAEVKDTLDARVRNLKAEAASYGYSYSAYLKAVYGPYMSTGVYERLYTQGLLANLVYNEKGRELLDGYTEADLKAYYETDDHADSLDTFEYSYLYFTPAAVEEKDEDGNELDEDTVAKLKEEALSQAKKNAEAALDALKDGGSLSELAEEYELAESRYSDHETGVGVSSAPSAIREKLASMKPDDVELVENGESGYYVVIFHSRKLVQDPTKDVRHILALAETTTDEKGNVVAPTDEAWAAAKAEIEAIQAEFEAGSKTEDSFAALANEKSDDGNGTTGGLITKIDIDDTYVPEFLEWIFTDGRKVGDTGIVQHKAKDSDGNKYWGYHFIYMVGDNEPVWMRKTRTTKANEDLDAWVDELLVNYQAALTGGADRIGV